jgi:ribonuclease HI
VRDQRIRINGRKEVRIYSDSSAALQGIQDNGRGAGQWLVRRIVKREKLLLRRGYTVEYHRVPGHEGIRGNEEADKAAKEAATIPIMRGVKRIPREESFTTLAHLHRKTNEKKTKETTDWLQKSLGDRQGYKLSTTKRPDEKAMHSQKRLATRYYQLKIGHAVIGTHLKRINTIDDDRCWWCNTDERQPSSISSRLAQCGQKKDKH